MKKLLLLILFCTTNLISAQTNIKNVDAETFKKAMENKGAILIDLRTSDEITQKGMIKGAKQIDFLDKNIEETISKLDKKKPYLIYCAAGGRSGSCAELMKKLSFKEVINLEKGFEDWKRKGFETEKK